MKCSDFRTWVERRRDAGMTEKEIAKMLGCGVNSMTRWKWYDPPFYIGLAIAAIEADLKPWRKSCR
jgi:hypothetical protein